MSRNQSVSESPVTAFHDGTAVPSDMDFDARWAACQARGVAHDRAVRRKLVILATVLAGLAVPAVILFVLYLL